MTGAEITFPLIAFTVFPRLCVDFFALATLLEVSQISYKLDSELKKLSLAITNIHSIVPNYFY